MGDSDPMTEAGGPEIPEEEIHSSGVLTAFSTGVSAVLAIAMTVAAIADRNLFFAGVAVAFAGRAYRTVAFRRLARQVDGGLSGHESALRVLKRSGGAYALGGALCAISAVMTHEPLPLALSVLFLVGGAALWFSPRWLGGAVAAGRPWPMRWFP